MKPIADQIADGDTLCPEDERTAYELAASLGLEVFFVDTPNGRDMRPLFYALADRLAAMEKRIQQLEGAS